MAKAASTYLVSMAALLAVSGVAQSDPTEFYRDVVEIAIFVFGMVAVAAVMRADVKRHDRWIWGEGGHGGANATLNEIIALHRAQAEINSDLRDDVREIKRRLERHEDNGTNPGGHTKR